MELLNLWGPQSFPTRLAQPYPIRGIAGPGSPPQSPHPAQGPSILRVQGSYGSHIPQYPGNQSPTCWWSHPHLNQRSWWSPTRCSSGSRSCHNPLALVAAPPWQFHSAGLLQGMEAAGLTVLDEGEEARGTSQGLYWGRSIQSSRRKAERWVAEWKGQGEMLGVVKVWVQGRRTVLWAVPPAWPLSLGRHQGVSLCVIVQVLLAAPTSVRAVGKRGLGGGGRRRGAPSPSPELS